MNASIPIPCSPCSGLTRLASILIAYPPVSPKYQPTSDRIHNVM
jgi:hypothetical protein